MADNDRPLANDLLYSVIGLALVFLAQTHIDIGRYSFSLNRTLITVGVGLGGYGVGNLLGSLKRYVGEQRRSKSMDRLFSFTPKIVGRSITNLPAFIATDVEGCITPPHRAEVNLRKFQRLRTYCEFVRSDAGRRYPPLVIYTGRSQGYVELLAQSLGMINETMDLPFVIENGSALYFPYKKWTKPLISHDQTALIHGIRTKLMQALPENEFEPKAYMITINVAAKQTIDDLLQEVILKLQGWGDIHAVTVNSTASAVDITAKGIDKWSGLKHSIKCDPKSIVALADSTSDLCVIREVGCAYCSVYDSHPEVVQFIKTRFGDDHIIQKPHIDFVVAAVETTCGLRLL